MTEAPTNSVESVRARVRDSARLASTAAMYELLFQALGTQCRVKFHCPNPQLARSFQSEVLDWVAAFEARYSRFLPDSLISRINLAAGLHWVDVDPETDALLQLCHEMVFFTRGVFDPTALPLMRLWNWKAPSPTVPSEATVAATRELTGWRKVQRRKGAVFLPVPGMCLDLGGIGKEFAVDRVLELALHRGVPNVLVDFGQDIRVHGGPPERGFWGIGLQDPCEPGRCWTGVAVNNHAVTTSGDYLRHFTAGGRRYGHIIDPRDGYPVNNGCLAVSVIAPNCTLAGILSTTAFVLGAREGLDLIQLCPGVEAAIVSENSRSMTPQFQNYTTR